MSRDHLDMLLDQLLREVLGGDRPRDMTGRVLARAKVYDKVRRRWWISAGAALAACLALAATLWMTWPREYPQPVVEGDYVVENGGPPSRGQIFWTQGGAKLALGGYVRATMEPGAAWTIGGEPLHEQVLLDRGEMDVQVAKKRGTFDVLVGSAMVHVVGTRFHLNVQNFYSESDGMSKHLTVTVKEGRVQVAVQKGAAEEELTANGLAEKTFIIPVEPLRSGVAATTEEAPDSGDDENAADNPETADTQPGAASLPGATPATGSVSSQPGPATNGRSTTDGNGRIGRRASTAPALRSGNYPNGRVGRLGNGPTTTRSNIVGRASTQPRAANAARPNTRTFEVVAPPAVGRLILEGRLVRDHEYVLLETPRGTFLLFTTAPAGLPPFDSRVRVVWENGKPTITEIKKVQGREN